MPKKLLQIKTQSSNYSDLVDLDPLKEIEVAEVFGEVLGLGDLLVVEEHPLAPLVDVADVVPAARVGAHVANNCLQAVHAISIIHRLTAGKEEKRNETQKQSQK